MADAVHLCVLRDLATNKPDPAGTKARFSPPPPDAAYIRARRCTIAICAALLLVFATLAWSAVSGKSPTADEPFHALAGWLHLWRGDYRFISDHPPLWSTLAAVATGPNAIHVDLRELDQMDLPMDARAQSLWAIKILFQTPGNDGAAIIAKFRVMMLAIAVGLGALLAGFVWRVSRAEGASAAASGAAAVLATALLALDPNFLAHSAIVKNDVASGLALLGLSYSTWAAGRELTLRRVLWLGIWSGVAMSVKFNAPLMIASSALLLFVRAILPSPWPVQLWSSAAPRRTSRTRGIFLAAGAVAVMGLMTFAIIWIGYGLRFAPSGEPGVEMDVPGVVDEYLVRRWQAQHANDQAAGAISQNELAESPQPMIVRLAVWANDRHILPQAFLAGILSVLENSQMRGGFLRGQSSDSGTWWYFPFAMAVKTPIATLAAFAAVLIMALLRLTHSRRDSATDSTLVMKMSIWTALCLGVPVVIYLAAAMSSNLNLGFRHVLPVYPLLFAAVGLGMARLWDWHRTTAMVSGLIVIAALAIESCSAYPSYLPFFNALAGGSRGGLRLLSDSNLDWGQDLPLLAAWQHDHPDQKLYLAYFGTTDPACYGIRYTNIDDGYFAGPPAQPIIGPGVLAISATTLQGPYCSQILGKPRWSTLWRLKPFEVLGGSIYLFHVPPARADYLPAGQSLIN